jgi:Skp family chaperone for outer membrane proteins
MKRFSLFAASLIFAAIFAVSAFGQVPAATTGNVKIVVINTAAFDAKDGIVKYSNAMNALEAEMGPLQTEINGLATRYQALGKEIQTLQANAQKSPAVPIDQKAAAAKVEEYQNLELTIKRKQEDGKRKFELRQPQVLGPVLQEIGKAIDEFAKQKGYGLVLDASKLEGAGLILAVDVAKVDVTKEFITFFNSRPAGTATTAAGTGAAPKQ